ncbi:MAG: aminotransferase class V-fold PLP-dependent enzyme [Polyangiales bacterium]
MPQRLSSVLDTPFARPEGALRALDALTRALHHHALSAQPPRHYGLFHPPVDPLAVAVEALVAGFDAQLAVRGAAPGPIALEAATLRWVSARFGLPAASHGSFTTGASEATREALLLALARVSPGFVRDGLPGLPARPVVYASREAHGSVEKAVRACGLGTSSLRRVRCDAAWRMDLRALHEAVREDRAAGRLPLAVVATAGTTNTGAVDPLPRLADLCAQEDLWLHVDAAWAGAAVFSPRTAALLDGVARADSLAWDAHKWLPLPLAAGVLLTAHPALPAAVFGVDAPYLPRGEGMPYRESGRWSRRFLGAGLFAWLTAHGEAGAARWVEEGCDRGDALRRAVTDAGWSLVAPTPLPLVAFTHDRVRRGEVAPQKVAQALRRAGAAWLSETWLDGRIPALHGSAMNPALAPADLDALTAALRDVARGSW